MDLRDNSVTLVGAMAENPVQSLFGTTRINVPPRQIAVDADGTAYIITLSGMTMVPLTPSGRPGRRSPPVARRSVNAIDGTRIFRPGSFIVVSGVNLATPAVTDLLAAADGAGRFVRHVQQSRSCRFFRPAASQILAQVPETPRPASYVVRGALPGVPGREAMRWS